MFALLFNYTILRDTKDVLVVTTVGELAIPTLKLWFVTPMAILFVSFYMKFSQLFSREKMFYISLTPLMTYFLLFGLVIYPNLDLFHPDPQWIQSLSSAYPSLAPFITVFCVWSISLFY
jgi:AAA family ATP:ADP antiporter